MNNDSMSTNFLNVKRHWKVVLITLLILLITFMFLLYQPTFKADSQENGKWQKTWQKKWATQKGVNKATSAAVKKPKRGMEGPKETWSKGHGTSQRESLVQKIKSKINVARSDVRAPKAYGRDPVIGDCYSYSNAVRLLPPHKLRRNHCRKRLPKAMIIGVKKCGTMTLQQYLQLHTSIAINGEIDFPEGVNFTAEDVMKWRERMRFSSPRMLPMTEKPGFIHVSVQKQQRMRSFLGDEMKFIVIIRDPVTRAVSDYVHKLTTIFQDGFQRLPRLQDSPFSITYRGDKLSDTFKKTVIDTNTGEVRGTQGIIELGRYVEDLRGFLEVYDREKLLILDGNAFIEDPLPTLKRVEEFLGVPKFFKREHFRRNTKTGFFCAYVPERPQYSCANPKSKGRPHPAVDGETEQKLRDYYRPFNLQLAAEFDLDFPWLFK